MVQVMLFGASDTFEGDKKMQVTVAFNHFGRGLVQRMPRCRWGFFHVVNNDYTHWLMYAIGGSQHPTIISQGNRFIAPPNVAAKEVINLLCTHEDTCDKIANMKNFKNSIQFMTKGLKTNLTMNIIGDTLIS